MNLRTFIASLPSQYYAWGSIAPQPLNLHRHAEILNTIHGMTAPGTLELLAVAVHFLDPGESYLEVGTWHGATLIGALRDSPEARGWAVDDNSMTGHDQGDPRAAWHANTERFGVAGRATYVDGHWPMPLDVPPVGVFLFDGDKATAEVALEGLEGVVPLLAPRALIVLDDANTPQIRTAAHQFCKRHPEAWVLVDIPTPANCFPTFWDGVMCLGWEKGLSF